MLFLMHIMKGIYDGIMNVLVDYDIRMSVFKSLRKTQQRKKFKQMDDLTKVIIT